MFLKLHLYHVLLALAGGIGAWQKQKQRLEGVEISLQNDACPWSGGAERAAWAGRETQTHPGVGSAFSLGRDFNLDKNNFFPFLLLFVTLATAKTKPLGINPGCLPG